MMSRKWAVRVVAVVLAVIMIGGVCVAALQVFAAGPAQQALAVIPATGDRNVTKYVVIFGAAAVLLIACVIVPYFAKKKK